MTEPYISKDTTINPELLHPSSITIACGSGEISINLKTGAVTLPADVPMEEAAITFWDAVTKAFPGVRHAIARELSI